jgi:hypothetical protein
MHVFNRMDSARRSFHAGSVESRTGAVAWAIRHHPVSRPRSSNRTCGFPASGFPTDFIPRLSAVRRCASGAAGARPVSRTRLGARNVWYRATAPCVAASRSHEPSHRRGCLPPDRPSAACRRRSIPPIHAAVGSTGHALRPKARRWRGSGSPPSVPVGRPGPLTGTPAGRPARNRGVEYSALRRLNRSFPPDPAPVRLRG